MGCLTPGNFSDPKKHKIFSPRSNNSWFYILSKKWNSDLLYTFNLLEFLKPEGTIEKWEYSVVRFINDQIDSILKNGKPQEDWKPYGENRTQLVLRHFGRKMKSTWFLQTHCQAFCIKFRSSNLVFLFGLKNELWFTYVFSGRPCS